MESTKTGAPTTGWSSYSGIRAKRGSLRSSAENVRCERMMRGKIKPVELVAAFLFAVSILLIVGHKYMPCVLMDGSISDGKHLVDCGRYGMVEVSPFYWWSSAVLQTLAAITICASIIMRILKKRKGISEPTTEPYSK
jgi:hypothetical protein